MPDDVADDIEQDLIDRTNRQGKLYFDALEDFHRIDDWLNRKGNALRHIGLYETRILLDFMRMLDEESLISLRRKALEDMRAMKLKNSEFLPLVLKEARDSMKRTRNRLMNELGELQDALHASQDDLERLRASRRARNIQAPYIPRVGAPVYQQQRMFVPRFSWQTG